MKTKKSAPKYAKPKTAVQSGFRRVRKSELKALGYSEKSALYTKADVANPTKFLTRAQITKNLEYVSPANTYYQVKYERINTPTKFHLISRVRIIGGIRHNIKRYKYTFAIYSGEGTGKTITLDRAEQLTNEFFEFIQNKYNPTALTEIGVEYFGDNHGIKLMPRLWSQRKSAILDQLRDKRPTSDGIRRFQKYESDNITQIIGWIELAH